MKDVGDIFNIQNTKEFDNWALDVFRYQFSNNPVYQSFCISLNTTYKTVLSVKEIPFLPIGLFKSHEVIVNEREAEAVFDSSGTSTDLASRHYVADLSIYEKSFVHGFENCYGKLEDYCILALLPSYVERKDSSLVYMVDSMIQKGKHPDSGFYLNNIREMFDKLIQLDRKREQVLLLGVSFALLDFSQQSYFNDFQGIDNLIIMETGGMKGRKKEMVREELHGILSERFNSPCIHSEYGMTELLSQAYSKGHGKFTCPPWMQVSIRDINDPFSNVGNDQAGGINIIDLANVYSCSFIATDDLGRCCEDGTFEVLGRLDQSDIRGCSQMV